MAKTPVSFYQKKYISSFRKRHPDTKLTDDEIFDIMKQGGSVIANCLLEDGSFKLGHRIGVLEILKFLPRGDGIRLNHLPINATASKLAGKPVIEMNDHSNGYVYKIKWNKRKCLSVKDKNMWVFKAIRSLNRQLAFAIKKQKRDYPAGSCAKYIS